MIRTRNILHAAGVVAVVAFGTSGFVGARLLTPASGTMSPVPAATDAARFEPWDLVIDPGGATLAAWQVSVECANGATVALVGVEGGDPAALHEPPAYDPDALAHHRLVLAAFSLADAAQLPTAPFRATTLHLEIRGAAPALRVHVDAAADANGQPLHPQAQLRRRALP